MEQTYSKEVAEVIAQRFSYDYLEYREDGVYIHEGYVDNDPTELFSWTPACELEGPDAPDALTAPALPIPFTARELGAFFLHGVGAHIVGCYGGTYESGPDEGMLLGLGIRAGKAREALHAAYAAILDAQNAVGTLNEAKQNRAAELRKQYADEHGAAIEREKVMEREIVGKHKNGNPEFGDDIPRDEYLLRLARAKGAVANLKLQLLQTETEADAESSAWRKGMVRQLLQTQSTTPNPATMVVDETWKIETQNEHEKYRRLWRAVRLDEGEQRAMIEVLERNKATTASEMEARKKKLTELRAVLAQIIRRKDMLASSVDDSVNHAAENGCIIEEMAEMRAYAIPINATQRADEIREANEEIDALIASNTPFSLSMQDGSTSGGVEPAKAEPAKPLQRTAAQDAAILCEIQKLGYDPLALPKNPNGKPGVKAAIRAVLKGNSLFVGQSVFKHAWERLTARGDIEIKG